MNEIEQQKEWDYQSKCRYCGGSDTQNGGIVNMIDGKYGLCTDCTEKVNA